MGGMRGVKESESKRGGGKGGIRRVNCMSKTTMFC